MSAKGLTLRKRKGSEMGVWLGALLSDRKATDNASVGMKKHLDEYEEWLAMEAKMPCKSELGKDFARGYLAGIRLAHIKFKRMRKECDM